MAAYIAAIIGFVVLCARLKAWLCGVPRLSKKQLDRHAMWRLRQIGERRMDARTACMVIPSEAELLASEGAFLQEGEQAKREIAAKQEAVQPAQPEIAPQDIIFEDGKAVIRPHTRMSVPVSTALTVIFRVSRPHVRQPSRLADGVDKVRQRVPGRQFDTIRLCPTAHQRFFR